MGKHSSSNSISNLETYLDNSASASSEFYVGYAEEGEILKESESLLDAKQNYELKQQEQVIEHLREQVNNIISAREMRVSYANKTFLLVCATLSFWAGVILFLMCWNIRHELPPISDNIFIAITAGVTANIFTAFLVVIRGIFKTNDDEVLRKIDDTLDKK